MDPMKLYFDVRDIFRAPRLALSGKKVIILGILGVELSGCSGPWHGFF